MKGRAFLALGLAGACWGLGFPLGKVVLRETDAAHLVLLRFAVAAIAALPFVLIRKDTRALFRSWPVLLSGVLYGVAFVIQFEGLAQVNVSLAALLIGLMPALVAVCARLLGEPIGKIAWAGVAAATLGAALIAGKPEGAGSPLGIALSLASLLVFLAWLFVLKKAPPSPTALAIPGVTVIVAALTIVPIALVLDGPPRLNLSPAAWTATAGQGLLSTLLATAAWQYGSTRVSSAAAGVFINVEPVMGAVLGVALFGERLGWPLVAGGLMVLGGSFVVVLNEKPAPPAPPTPA
jgi:drug/metabolite transporter (DMT)-like permease